jgi:two-component system LytT family response regulator
VSGSLRVVIVEDEPLARAELRALLDSRPGTTVVGEAGTVPEAAALIQREAPDVVLLDIHLGDASGFELVDGVERAFEVVFVTAFDQYAVDAFEFNAVDYLLKPVDPERLAVAMDRIERRRTRVGERVPASPPTSPLTRAHHLFLQFGAVWRFVRVDTLACIEAEGDYTRVVLRDGTAGLVHKAIRDWQAALPPALFQRIHRSSIVNLECVERVEEWSSYTFRVFVRPLERPLTMSRKYASGLKRSGE